ncbi:hypothetical protein Q5762_20575 [Streptomyces sp. P9(2023)]|uniref:hypothetical protein n=1 Tax=Streptomyces sp. P9(2023) TaxID=3064394 RepID=UPI0028F3EE80|nr:hypothetical protein [Streptomyces sp. P9(2023)]MDT9690695.1 hypothetical protein [Streptomyces sp. P9(2023)]
MRTRIRHGLAAALAVSALSLTAACGGGDAKGDTTKDKAADKPAAEQTTSAAPAATTPLTAAQMKAAALELKDLPSGWKVTKTPTDELKVTSDKPECAPLASALGSDFPGGTKGASAEFSRGNNESEIVEDVATFPGTGAADFTKKIDTALASCTGFTADSDGTKMKLGVEKLTAPQGAEETLAFRLKLNLAEGITIEPTIMIARQGSGIVRFLHLADTPGGKGEFDALAKIAAGKLAKAGQS